MIVLPVGFYSSLIWWMVLKSSVVQKIGSRRLPSHISFSYFFFSFLRFFFSKTYFVDSLLMSVCDLSSSLLKLLSQEDCLLYNFSHNLLQLLFLITIIVVIIIIIIIIIIIMFLFKLSYRRFIELHLRGKKKERLITPISYPIPSFF